MDMDFIFYGGVVPLELTYNGGVQSATDQPSPTTHNLGTIDYGSAASDRIVVAVIQLTVPDGAATVTGATIGGSAATIHAQQWSALANGHAVLTLIASRFIPTGTSGAVTITFSAGKTSRHYRTDSFRITGRSNNTAYATNTSTATPVNVGLNAEAGGVVIAVAGAGGTSPNPSGISWSSGMTEHTDLSVETSPFSRYSVASKEVTTGGSQTVSATISGTNDKRCGCAVAWSAE